MNSFKVCFLELYELYFNKNKVHKVQAKNKVRKVRTSQLWFYFRFLRPSLFSLIFIFSSFFNFLFQSSAVQHRFHIVSYRITHESFCMDIFYENVSAILLQRRR